MKWLATLLCLPCFFGACDMPVNQVTRSQIAHATWFKVGKFVPFFSPVWVVSFAEKYKPAVSDRLAGVVGTLAPEPVVALGPEQRGGALTYPFQPSHLRTRYTITDIAITVPPLNLEIVTEKEEELEAEIEQGWVVQIKLAGAVVFSEIVSSSRLKQNSVKGLWRHASPPKRVQLQLTQEIVATPGASIEVELIPFVEFISIQKSPVLGIEALELVSFLEKVPLSSTLVYSQEFDRKG